MMYLLIILSCYIFGGFLFYKKFIKVFDKLGFIKKIVCLMFWPVLQIVLLISVAVVKPK